MGNQTVCPVTVGVPGDLRVDSLLRRFLICRSLHTDGFRLHGWRSIIIDFPLPHGQAQGRREGVRDSKE